MMSDLIRMQQLLQGGTLSDVEVASLRQCAEAISRTARQSARRIGRTFALLCETFATVDPEQLPPELRAEIEAIALGRDLPEPDTSGPVTPMDLLQIATRLVAMGERADAARLRRLADDLVAKSDPQQDSNSAIGRALALMLDYYSTQGHLIGNGCEHGFKPARSCPNDDCLERRLHCAIDLCPDEVRKMTFIDSFVEALVKGGEA